MPYVSAYEHNSKGMGTLGRVWGTKLTSHVVWEGMGWDVAMVVVADVAPLFPTIMEKLGDCMGTLSTMGHSGMNQTSNLHDPHLVILLYQDLIYDVLYD